MRWVRPRHLAAALALVGLLAIVAAVVLLLGRSRGPIADVTFSAESTATVAYAGRFPAEGEPALLNPLGIDIRNDTLYVAESDAGRVSIFGLDGSAKGVVALPVAEGAPSAYPSDLAVLGDDRLVVVDNAGLRVLIMHSDPKAKGSEVLTVGGGDATTRPIQPTAIAVGDGEIFVADAGDRTIKVYGFAGAFARVIAGDLDQTLTFVGGMVVQGSDLFVTDSNAGRIVVVDTRTGALKRTFPDARVLPRGVSLGSAGGVLVVDTFERSVSHLSAEGDVIDEIDGTIVGDAALGSPRDVAWSGTRTLAYVTDAASGRVVAYKMRPPPE
jgi:DNA-binding beta-propeller fold protein YncE